MFFVALLFFITPLFSGFVGDTLITTDTQFIPIKQMHIHDNVQSIDVTNFNGTHSGVTGVYNYTVSHAVIITLIDGTVIISAPNQQFYDYDTHEWKFAIELQSYDRLLCKGNRSVIVQSIAQFDSSTTLYDLTVDRHHNFYVTAHEILVHNAVFAVVAAAPVILGYCIVACTLGYLAKKTDAKKIFDVIESLFRDKKNKTQRKQKEAPSTGLSSPQLPPDDPEKFKKEHPHGRYEDAPYHKNHQSGRKSPRPIDGQAARDSSFEISGSKNSRVGVSNQEIVMLRRTLGDVYHGYVVEFDDLLHEIQSVLIKQRVVNGRGKFL